MESLFKHHRAMRCIFNSDLVVVDGELLVSSCPTSRDPGRSDPVFYERFIRLESRSSAGTAKASKEKATKGKVPKREAIGSNYVGRAASFGNLSGLDAGSLL